MALIKCPDCGKMISSRALQCPNCGCPVVVEKPKMVCPECGEAISEGDSKCPNCGCPSTMFETAPISSLNNESSPIAQEKAEHIIYICPICGRTMSEKPSKCPICGVPSNMFKTINNSGINNSGNNNSGNNNNVSNSNSNKCKNCGFTPLSPYANVCPQCGHPTDAYIREYNCAVQANEKKRGSLRKFFLILFIVPPILFLLAGLGYIGSSDFAILGCVVLPIIIAIFLFVHTRNK